MENLNRMKKHCLALDLKDDPELIAEYEAYHKRVWPEIIKSIKESGIEVLDIYRTGNRMFMIIEANDDFSFAAKAKMDADNAKVQEWETLMWKFQQALPRASHYQTSNDLYQMPETRCQDKDKTQRGSIASILFPSIILKVYNKHLYALLFHL